MKTANTIEGVEIKPERMCGNSTRQIDHAIQLIFKGYSVVVLDHYDDGKNRKMNTLLYERICKRLHAEHQYLVNSGRVIFDKNRLEITLTPF